MYTPLYRTLDISYINVYVVGDVSSPLPLYLGVGAAARVYTQQTLARARSLSHSRARLSRMV